ISPQLLHPKPPVPRNTGGLGPSLQPRPEDVSTIGLQTTFSDYALLYTSALTYNLHCTVVSCCGELYTPHSHTGHIPYNPL
ncbi:unnamed protein product, partial [Coregonus sp. 'balchen']